MAPRGGTRNASPAAAAIAAPPSLTPTSNNIPAELIAQLAELNANLKSYAERLERIESILAITRQENAELKTSLSAKDSQILKLKEKLNDQEQYARGWSIRILNLKIPANEATDPDKVMQHVFQRVLEPIFQGALSRKLISTIPSPHAIMETAHILPAKQDAVNPVIVRFFTRNIRNMLFRLKREFAPKAPASQPASSGAARRDAPEAGRYLYPFFEDLTRINFDKMRAIASHPSVQSCWSAGGVIRFKLKNSDSIRKVKCVFSDLQDILKG
jgi:hypothetical protein